MDQRVSLITLVVADLGAEVRPATARDWGGYSGYFTDPNGFWWEVAHAPGELGEFLVPVGSA